jgi:hypothetical protein
VGVTGCKRAELVKEGLLDRPGIDRPEREDEVQHPSEFAFRPRADDPPNVAAAKRAYLSALHNVQRGSTIQRDPSITTPVGDPHMRALEAYDRVLEHGEKAVPPPPTAPGNLQREQPLSTFEANASPREREMRKGLGS